MTKAKVTDFKQHKANANKGSERGEYMIETSLREVGAWRSVGADRNGTIGVGNKTTQKWQEIANPDDVIVVPTDGTKLVIVQRTDLDFDSDDPAVVERTIKAAYFDNRASEVSMTWDAEQVLADITAGVDLDAMFRHDELDELLADLLPKTEGDAEPQIDRAAELNEVWQVQPGDVWEIGSHRLVCGDCTDPAVVAKVMGGEKADALFTDPPYGINYDPSWLDDVGRRRQALSSRNTLANDDGSLDLSFLWEYERRMVWGFPYIYDADSTGWIVWDKQPGVEKRGIVTPIEMASTTMRKGFDMVRVMWGGYYRAAGEDKQPHPTQKPISVYSPYIESWTKSGEVIYDPFCGSGPVIVACEQLGRRGRGVEISPNYCAVILQRMQDAFNLTGVRLG